MKLMWLPIAALAVLVPLAAQKSGDSFLGRWDMTITATDSTYPGWLEVTELNGKMAARVQPRTGSVHPATDVVATAMMSGPNERSGLSLTVSQATPLHPPLAWDLSLKDGKLTGTQHDGDTVNVVTGVRAPALDHPAPKAWANPEPLFDGKDLTGWQPDKPAANHWVARNGELLNESKGANLRTTRSFDDFKLHIEYNCPQGGNSGIYLRGRYELQVEYEPVGANDTFHEMGAIYGFLAPAVELPKKPGQWESFDVTLVGRRLTVLRNGVKTIDNQEIPGITGGALDSHEGEPGPIYIQGDHTGGMKYRNITIASAKK